MKGKGARLQACLGQGPRTLGPTREVALLPERLDVEGAQLARSPPALTEVGGMPGPDHAWPGWMLQDTTYPGGPDVTNWARM